MNSNQFNFKFIVQVVFIGITTSLFAWTINEPYLMITRITLGGIWIIQIVSLIIYVNKTNRDLYLFLKSFQYSDQTLSFNKKENLPFKPLYNEFNRIIEDFKGIKIEKEAEHQFFQYCIENVYTGLISYDSEGHIHLVNDAAKTLLGISVLQNISDLEKVKPGLSSAFNNLRPGDQKLIKLNRKNEVLSITLRSSEFKLNKQTLQLVSLQDIKAELVESELMAWKKLIKVLTHEIINSVSPISLLSSRLIGKFKQSFSKEVSDPSGNDELLSGLLAINKRSKGLSDFVENYRQINKLPEPQIKEFVIYGLLSEIHELFKKELEEKNIKLTINCKPETLKVDADEKLLSQVLINILKNAIDAVSKSNSPAISVSAFSIDGENKISFTDNGVGISGEEFENIFIPFYTTKDDGSGIGLTLSRQIMRMHNGDILVKSVPGEGSTFTLRL